MLAQLRECAQTTVERNRIQVENGAVYLAEGTNFSAWLVIRLDATSRRVLDTRNRLPSRSSAKH